MATLETITERAQQLIGGNVPGSASLDAFASQAIAKVDAAKPREYRNAITGDGSDEYSLPSPWLQGFSSILSVQLLDSDGSAEAPTDITPEEYQLERDTSGDDQLRLLEESPAATQTIVVMHTARHTLDSTTSTLITADEEPFAELVAGLALRSVIARVLSSHDQRTDSDRAAVDVARAEQLRSLMRDLLKSAYAHFGITDENAETPSTPRSASRDADREMGWGIRRYRHTHSRRWA